MREVGRSGDVVGDRANLAARHADGRTGGLAACRRSVAPTLQRLKFRIPTWSVCTPREEREGVNRVLTLSDLRDLLPLLRKEEGQTMAEYGVVLAVITIGAVAAFTALSGGVTKAISSVTALLP